MALTTDAGYGQGRLEVLHQQSIDQQRAIQNQQTQLQIQMTLEQRARDNKERELLGNAFQFNSASNDSTQSNLPNLYYQAGQKVMGIDPKMGMSLLKEGDALTSKQITDQFTTQKIAAAKEAHLADTAMGISDQETLNEAIQDFSKSGIVIPERFRTWNPATEAWFRQKADQSKIQQKVDRLNLKTEEVGIKQEGEDRKKAGLLLKNEATLRQEKLQRDKMAARGAGWKEPTESAVYNESVVLKGVKEYDKLDASDKTEAARDVYYNAYNFLKNGTAKTQAEAMDMAKKETLGKISDGKYNKASPEPTKSEYTTSSPATPTSMEDFNALPKGAIYKHPNGKLYRKQ